ncbi:MAG: DUF1178 family protein [Pseudomonadota bacterium]
MIRFALKCESDDHRFESWFQSGAAFDGLLDRKLVQCPVCGGTSVTKDLMAPKVRSNDAKLPETKPMMQTSDPEVVQAIAKLRDHVEKNSEYVGENFAREARAMHVGDRPARAIYGEVNKGDAKSLIDDGVPALPLPFDPRQKTN